MWGYLIGSGKDLSRIETQQGGEAEQEMPWVLGKPFSCIIKKKLFLALSGYKTSGKRAGLLQGERGRANT